MEKAIIEKMSNEELIKFSKEIIRPIEFISDETKEIVLSIFGIKTKDFVEKLIPDLNKTVIKELTKRLDNTIDYTLRNLN
jgi:hypothetical protein